MPIVPPSDIQMIRANAQKILLEMRAAGSTGGVGGLFRNINGCAAAILRLTDRHVIPDNNVTPLRRE